MRNPRPLNILVVEDHDLLRKLFAEAFGGEHVVCTACNAEEGWNLFHDKSPQIVFLDINLPDASGHELARRIKEDNPHVHVIMATSSRALSDVEKASQNAVDGYIVKPFDRQKIAGYIDRYMAAHPSKN